MARLCIVAITVNIGSNSTRVASTALCAAGQHMELSSQAVCVHDVAHDYQRVLLNHETRFHGPRHQLLALCV